MAQSALQAAVAAGQLIAVAAGNNGQANPSWPARFAKETWANGQIIAVGAVDANNVIASFSNRAGDTMNYYVVAPGVNVLSTYKGGGYAWMSGTSMAAPAVAGAAADIKSYWYLSGKQIVSVIFTTATDLGAPGIDEVYGYGLLNLQAAMSPVGVVTTTTASGKTTQLTYAVLVPGTTNQYMLKTAAASGKFSLTGFDAFGRNFQFDMGQAVVDMPVSATSQMFDAMDGQMRLVERSQNGMKLAVAYDWAATMPAAVLGMSLQNVTWRPTLSGFAYSRTASDGTTWGMGANGFADKFFGLASTGMTPVSLTGTSKFGNPYFGLVANSSHLGFGFVVADGTQVRFGLLSGANPLASQYIGQSVATGGSVLVAEFEKRVGDGVMTVSGGVVKESNAYLGDRGAGLFALEVQPATTFLAFGTAYPIADKTYLSGTVSMGTTAAVSNPNSALSDTSATRTLSWAVGLARTDAFQAGDKVGFSVSQPMKVVSGSINLTAPQGVDILGNPVMGTTRIGLVSPATELDTELNYSAPVGKLSTVSLAGMYRLHPNHDANDEPESVIGARYQARFY